MERKIKIKIAKYYLKPFWMVKGYGSYENLYLGLTKERYEKVRKENNKPVGDSFAYKVTGEDTHFWVRENALTNKLYQDERLRRTKNER